MQCGRTGTKGSLSAEKNEPAGIDLRVRRVACGGDEGNRTLTTRLGSWGSTIELRPHGPPHTSAQESKSILILKGGLVNKKVVLNPQNGSPAGFMPKL